MENDLNPYLPVEQVDAVYDDEAKKAARSKQVFRWQVVPVLFCCLSIFVCGFWLYELLTMRIQFFRGGWEILIVPYAHVLATATNALLGIASGGSFIIAIRRWLSRRHLSATICTALGMGAFALSISDSYFILDFWATVTTSTKLDRGTW